MKTMHLVLGNQLFADHPALSEPGDILMIEAYSLCAKLPYHKHKLILLLSSMRSFADFARARGKTVHYVELHDKNIFSDELAALLAAHKPTKLTAMQPNDSGTLPTIQVIAESAGCELRVTKNLHFYQDADDFAEWRHKNPKAILESYYRTARRNFNILMDDEQKPIGGNWNYDHENRRALPKEIDIPAQPTFEQTHHNSDVSKVIDQLFADNPGKIDSFWLATTHEQALTALNTFVSERLANFGAYEDAMRSGESWLFHSVLSPYLNIGLLTPQQCIEAAIEAFENGSAPLNSVEGFVRQILGWREYMHGMYHAMPELASANFFGFTKQLEDWWYSDAALEQDLPEPVLHALKSTLHYGYNHHIERLMILGNWFLLNEYDPHSVNRWFTAMFVDAYEWVMLPNVIGMSQYADGGVIATKPYISGGNYLQKMGGFYTSAAAAKDSEFTAKYWEFLQNNYEKLKGNHRMTIALNQALKRQKT